MCRSAQRSWGVRNMYLRLRNCIRRFCTVNFRESESPKNSSSLKIISKASLGIVLTGATNFPTKSRDFSRDSMVDKIFVFCRDPPKTNMWSTRNSFCGDFDEGFRLRWIGLSLRFTEVSFSIFFRNKFQSDSFSLRLVVAILA